MNNGKKSRSFRQQILGGALFSKAVLLAGFVFGAALAINQANAEDYGWVKAQLDWSAGDHGFNEGGLCGMQALQGIAGIALPNVPFQYQIIGNVWDRTNMMNAAQAAFRMGFVGPAVNTALCSQAHNPPVQAGLAQRQDLIVAWFNSR